jgi:ankyrin repeat protein
MKNATFLIAFLIIPFFSMCIFPSRNDNHNSENSNSKYISIEESIEKNKNRIDFSKIEISKDSLDLKLYYLVDAPGDIPEDLLLKNIENLVQRGANPNALVEITYSVRKLGTYIPIVKSFYKNKYNEYTTSTSPMHAAVGSKNIRVVEKLISLGGNTDIINQDKLYPIDVALRNDQEEMIDCLIKHGCKISNVDLGMSENTTLIEKLVKLGADPKTINLNYALENKPELKRLLALKPNINDGQLNFETVLGNEELLDLLLAGGMSPNIIGRFPNDCPIIFAAVKLGNIKAFKKLVLKGANYKGKCDHGIDVTTLQVAIHYSQLEMMTLLLDMKANPNEKDWTGKSVLFLACSTDNDQVINTLLDRGAELEYNGYFGKTPLLYAVQMKYYISAATLIKRKANVNFTTNDGETALSLAIVNNDYAMIKMLVESGANPKIKFKGKTLVEYARESEAAPVVISYLENLVVK